MGKQRKEGFCSDTITISEQRSFSFIRKAVHFCDDFSSKQNAPRKCVNNAAKEFKMIQEDMTMKKRKTVKPILVSFVMLLCLVGAGWTHAASVTKGFTDFAHIEAEYLESLEKLDWPEGMTLPEKLEGEEKSTFFQVGYGDTRASLLWEYTWIKEWLDTYQTEPERAGKALEALETAFDMPYMGEERCDDATRKYLRENIKKAKEGDPSGFMESIRANTPDESVF